MAKRIVLELPEDLARKVDQARGDVPRVRFIRRLLAESLGIELVDHVPGPDVTRTRSSAQAKADVRPIPKKG